MAFLHAILREAGDVEVRTDSQYVVTGLSKLRLRGLTSIGSHEDLWSRVHDAIGNRASCVRAVKVLGHAKWRDVHAGRVLIEDKIGNSHADTLAVAGAEMHLGVGRIGALAKEPRQATMKLHRMYLDILLEQQDLTEQIVAAREELLGPQRFNPARLHHFARPR